MLLESVFKAFLGLFGILLCIYTIESKTLKIKPLEKSFINKKIFKKSVDKLSSIYYNIIVQRGGGIENV